MARGILIGAVALTVAFAGQAEGRHGRSCGWVRPRLADPAHVSVLRGLVHCSTARRVIVAQADHHRHPGWRCTHPQDIPYKVLDCTASHHREIGAYAGAP